MNTFETPREERLGERAGLVVAHRLRHLRTEPWCTTASGVAAAGEERHHAIAEREAAGVGPDLRDGPRALEAQDVRRARRGGYMPCRCSRSARLTAVAIT